MRQEVPDIERALPFISRVMDDADQPPRAGRVKDQTIANLIGGRVISSHVAETPPNSSAGSSPPVVEPVAGLRVATSCRRDCRPSDDVHGVV